MIESFLEYIRCELTLSACTVSAYTIDLQEWAEWATNGKPEELDPGSVTQSDLRAWVAYLSRRGRSARTIRRKVSALRSFFRYLCRRHGFQSNPAAELQTARPDKILPSFVRTGEMNAIIDTEIDPTDFEEVRNKLILTMFYTCGLRCSELINLRDADINLHSCELKVHGKRNKDRILPFGKELREQIEAYRELRPSGPGPEGEFFTRPNGLALYRKAVYNLVHEALQGATVGKRSPHVLRHTFATDMLNGGADIDAVRRLLGHSSLATTQVYTHVSLRDLKNNYQQAHPRAQRKGENYGNQNSSNPL
ncbi:MAG: tyrosine-type recombinase/integrase [Bacteroides sp.]|nr:tyrosine-type recombinase/integrase [Bacteroides sp.]